MILRFPGPLPYLAGALPCAVLTACVWLLLDASGQAASGLRASVGWLGAACTLLSAGCALLAAGRAGRAARDLAQRAALALAPDAQVPQAGESLQPGEAVDALARTLAETRERLILADQEARSGQERAGKAERLAAAVHDRVEAGSRQGMLGAAGALKAAVGQIQDRTAELGREVGSAAGGAARLAEMVSQTARAMEQLDQGVLEAAKNATQAATLAGQARQRAERGAAVVEAVVASIGDARQHTVELKGAMEQLGRKTQSIGQIMTVISDIADQTNLLALNAAIEAARAGEAGRGFAVVADEVRKLAEKTMSATRDVAQVISAIQAESDQALAGMDQTAAQVERATDQARESGQALSDIVDIVEKTSDQVRGIATAAEQQSAASAQIGRTVEDVQNISDQTLSGMGQCQTSLDHLLGQLTTLANLQGVFTMLGRGTAQDLIDRLVRSEDLLSLGRERIESALRRAVARAPFVELAYMTDADGVQIVDNIAPTGFAASYAGTGYGRNWSTRPWFLGAMKNKDIFISEMYVGAASQNPCITVSAPVAGEDGKILGVLGLDVKLGD